MTINTELCFYVEHGLALGNIVGIYSGITDPSAVGEVAPVGSLFLRNTGELWQKTAPPNTSWAKFSTGNSVLRVSSTDTTSDYLNNKFLVTSNLTKTILNASANEQVRIDLNTTGVTAGSGYNTLTVDSFGRITSGTRQTTLSGVGIVDAQALNSNLSSLSILTTPGVVTMTAPGTVTARTVTGTTNQITITNGNGVSGNPTIAITDNPVVGGTAGLTLPVGTTAQRAGGSGASRFNSSTLTFEYYDGTQWQSPIVNPLSADFMLRDSINDVTSTSLLFQKNRAGAIAQSGDLLGSIQAQMWTGSAYVSSAEIRFIVDGTPGVTNDAPSKVSVYTTADASGTRVERLAVHPSGQLTIGNAIPTSSLGTKTVIISDATTPTFTSTHGGIGVQLAGGAALIVKNSTDSVEARLESFAGAINIGTSNSSVYLQLYANSTTVPALTINTSANALIGTGTTNVLNAQADTTNRLEVAGGHVALQPVDASNTAQLRFKELAANGTTHVGFAAPALIASSVMWTLPNVAATAGQVLGADTTTPTTLAWRTVVDTDNRASSNDFDDFTSILPAGRLGWTPVVSGTSAAVTTGVTSLVGTTYQTRGLIQLATGTTATGRAGQWLGATEVIGVGTVDIQWRVAIPTLSTSAQRYVYQSGMLNNMTADQTYGVYFEYTDSIAANWVLVCANNSSRTKSTTTVPVQTTNFVTLRTIITGSTQADFYISVQGLGGDFTFLGTINTNLPPATAAGAVGPGILLRKTVGTTSVSAIADYMNQTTTFTSQRN